MKNLILVLLVLVFSFSLVSCDRDAKEIEEKKSFGNSQGVSESEKPSFKLRHYGNGYIIQKSEESSYPLMLVRATVLIEANNDNPTVVSGYLVSGSKIREDVVVINVGDEYFFLPGNMEQYDDEFDSVKAKPSTSIRLR